MILPASRQTTAASSCLRARSRSPIRRTNSPRTGPGTTRHCEERLLRTADCVDHVTGSMTGEPAELTSRDGCAGGDGAVVAKLLRCAAAPQGGEHFRPRSDSVVGRVVMIVR